MTTSSSIVLDDVFKLLSLASEIEKQNHIEAATKYYEAVHLMKRHLEHGVPVSLQSQDAVKKLLNEKISHYEKVASALLSNTNESRDETHYNPSQNTSSRSTTKICSNSYHNKNDERLRNWTIGGTGTTYTTTTDTISCLTDETAIINETIRLANIKLSYALDLDEMGRKHNVNNIIQAYMDASDMLLLAIKSVTKNLATNTQNGQNSNIELSVVNVLKRRLLQTLDRIEQLKKQSTTTTTTTTHNNKQQQKHSRPQIY